MPHLLARENMSGGVMSPTALAERGTAPRVPCLPQDSKDGPCVVPSYAFRLGPKPPELVLTEPGGLSSLNGIVREVPGFWTLRSCLTPQNAVRGPVGTSGVQARCAFSSLK